MGKYDKLKTSELLDVKEIEDFDEWYKEVSTRVPFDGMLETINTLLEKIENLETRLRKHHHLRGKITYEEY
jgi:hypothetical protein